MIQYINDILDFSNDKKEECTICFEEKKLKYFCENHKFCDKCCKDWIKQNMFCPICRLNCINIKYLKYYFELKGELKNNIDDLFSRNVDFFFLKWHKETCIKKKHKFHIRMKRNEIINTKSYILHCTECNVEQDYKFSI